GYTATSSTVGATFAWTRAVVVGIANGAGAGATALINESLDNTTTAPVAVTYIITPSYAGCPGTPFNLVVTVNPTPTLSSSLTPADVCSNTAFSYIPTSATAGTSFNWTRAVVAGITPAGPTFGPNNPNETLVNITSAPIAVTYQYTLTANGCSNVQNVVVNIKPEPVGSNDATTLCSGNALNYSLQGNIDGNNAVPSVFTYSVTSSDPGNVPPEADRIIPSNSPISHTYINTTGTIVTVIYTITPVSNPGGCTGADFTFTVTLGAQPVLDPNLNKFACSNEPIGLILKEAPLSVVPTDYDILDVTYPAGLTPDAGNVPHPSSTTLANYLSNDKFTNTTTGNLNVTYRVQPRVGTDCIGNPVDIIVTVRPPVTGGVLSGNTSICYNTDAPVITNLILASGGDGVITYSWYYTENMAAVPGDLNWILIGGENGSDYDPGVLINPTKFIRKANDGSCVAVAYSNPITININPLPITSDIEGESIICENAINEVYQIKTPRTPGSTYTWTVPPSLTITSPQGLY
ncbi:MAG: PKD-like domain-containing protein, partial [Alphaproteobacteria bacterium]